MSGPTSKQMQQSQGYGKEASQTAGQLQTWAGEDRATKQALQTPAFGYNWAMAKGGDAARGAAGPIIETTNAIYDTLAQRAAIESPRGAAATKFASMIPQSKAETTASTIQGEHLKSFSELASFGLGEGATALQEFGAALRGTGAAMESNREALQAKAAQKQATMGFLGQLAGAGGGVASKYLSPTVKPPALATPGSSAGVDLGKY